LNPACRWTTPKRDGEREYGLGDSLVDDGGSGAGTWGAPSFSLHAASSTTHRPIAKPEIAEEALNP